MPENVVLDVRGAVTWNFRKQWRGTYIFRFLFGFPRLLTSFKIAFFCSDARLSSHSAACSLRTSLQLLPARLSRLYASMSSSDDTTFSPSPLQIQHI
ncbi:hypothetical protein [Stenotrophomonas sp. PFBMAA-4]|uniref:hypothetical protein n=1 Tax=Stenotrophomonas sp. PFBMAA-4 TaxID=3043301 RepID=UPI0024B4C05A|nr:hypothetical protein [Stenotrophomonas sp. PFBMAA-4]MDI9273947.1 hypothetical protein [Stenotrophomonas sp. PFBMAA-4]